MVVVGIKNKEEGEDMNSFSFKQRIPWLIALLSCVLGLTLWIVCGAENKQPARKKIMITGGAGFIGSHLAQALIARGDGVVIVDNFCPMYDPAWKQRNVALIKADDPEKLCTIYESDILDMEKMSTIMAHERPDVICHLAGYADLRASIEKPEEHLAINTQGTLNILQLTRKFGIENLIFASSSSVYGNNPNVPFKEPDDTDRPTSPYAASKKAGELLAYTYHHLFGLRCACLRLFTVYGPRGTPNMAAFKFMDAVHNEKSLVRYDQENSLQRDFTYVGDIVDGIVASIDGLMQRTIDYQVINLGSGSTVSLDEFVNVIEQVVGKGATFVRLPAPRTEMAVTCADISKAQALLGYQPKTSLFDGIKAMYEWYVDEYCKQLVVSRE